MQLSSLQCTFLHWNAMIFTEITFSSFQCTLLLFNECIVPAIWCSSRKYTIFQAMPLYSLQCAALYCIALFLSPKINLSRIGHGFRPKSDIRWHLQFFFCIDARGHTFIALANKPYLVNILTRVLKLVNNGPKRAKVIKVWPQNENKQTIGGSHMAKWHKLNQHLNKFI